MRYLLIIFVLYLSLKIQLSAQCVQGNCVNGVGKFIYSDGGVYEGQFKNGVWDGEGTVKWPSGSSYKGGFYSGKKHGIGLYRYNTGDLFEGEYSYGNMLKGTYVFPNGDKYVGEFKNSSFNGKGIYYYKNGDKLECEFINGLAHGKGRMSSANGSIMEGIWNNGNLINTISNASSLSENSKTLKWLHSNGGFVQTQKKSANNYNIWSEDNNRFTYEETSIQGTDGLVEVVLKDLNRPGVIIKLTPTACFYKDNSNTNWMRIYNGNWSSAENSSVKSSTATNSAITENKNAIIFFGYNVGNWSYYDNSNEIICGVCNKKCAIEKTEIELESQKNSILEQIKKNHYLDADMFKKQLEHNKKFYTDYQRKNLYGGKSPEQMVFDDYLKDKSIKKYKSAYTYSNIFYNPLYVGHFCSQAHLDQASAKIKTTAQKNANAASQRVSASNSVIYAQPNAYQCSKCLFISNGNKEPLSYAYGGCNKSSPNGESHSWHQVNTNCEDIGKHGSYEKDVCGLQCSSCGEKCYILQVSVFVKCYKRPNGSGADGYLNHNWRPFKR